MTKRKTPKAAYNKSARYTHTMPSWYRALLHAINPKSSSKAMQTLVNHALQNGAAERLLGIPTATLVDPTSPGSPVNVETIAALVLGNRTPAQQVGGWTRMRNHIEVYGAPFVKPDGSLGWNDGRTPPAQQLDPAADLQATLDAFADWEDEAPAPRLSTTWNPIPAQVAHYMPATSITAAPISRSTASTIAETEAIMAEIQKGFSMPPP